MENHHHAIKNGMAHLFRLNRHGLTMASPVSHNQRVSHGQYSQKMVDGHPIHNKDPKIMVIINPYEPLDD